MPSTELCGLVSAPGALGQWVDGYDGAMGPYMNFTCFAVLLDMTPELRGGKKGKNSVFFCSVLHSSWYILSKPQAIL